VRSAEIENTKPLQDGWNYLHAAENVILALENMDVWCYKY
jgi:hypothetical protein